METKLCICGCGKWFIVTRSDRQYYDKDCRNRVSNDFSRIRLNILKQDAILSGLWENKEDTILVDENYFERWGIIAEYATKMNRNQEGKIMRLDFMNYSLIRMKNNFFQLIKYNNENDSLF